MQDAKNRQNCHLRTIAQLCRDVGLPSQLRQHGIPHHLFADDMQGIGHSKPSRVIDVATVASLERVYQLSVVYTEAFPAQQQQISINFHWPTNTSKSDLTVYRRPVLSATSASSSTLN